MAEAVALLRHLRQTFAHALPIGNELVLALLEQGCEDEALKELRSLEAQFRVLDDEAYCRFGKFFKNKAMAALAEKHLLRTESYLLEALKYYRLGYSVRSSHYPGINAAAMLFLLAGVAREQAHSMQSKAFQEQATAMAREVLDKRSQWPSLLPDDNIWKPATVGEAELILGNWKAAADQYSIALGHNNVAPFHPQTIGLQARRLLDGWKRLGATPGSPLDRPDDLFGPAYTASVG
jgi:MAP3K TRAFs-binding domain